MEFAPKNSQEPCWKCFRPEKIIRSDVMLVISSQYVWIVQTRYFVAKIADRLSSVFHQSYLEIPEGSCIGLFDKILLRAIFGVYLECVVNIFVRVCLFIGPRLRISPKMFVFFTVFGSFEILRFWVTFCVFCHFVDFPLQSLYM